METSVSLGPDARALIAAAKDGDDPSSEDAARVRAKVATRLAIAMAAGVAASSATKAATATTGAGAGAVATGATGTGVLTGTIGATGAKVLLAVAIVGGSAATGGAFALWTAPDGPRPAVTTIASASTPSVNARALAEPPPRDPDVSDDEPDPSSEAIASPVSIASLPLAPDDPSPAARRELRSTRASPGAADALAMDASAAAPPSSTSVLSVPDAVVDEVVLLRSAQAAIARGDGAGALAWLREHEERFPDGVMAEERKAVRVFALCASGRSSEARAAATAFVAASPRSPLAARVKRSCAERFESP